jgi:hypothetical protein
MIIEERVKNVNAVGVSGWTGRLGACSGFLGNFRRLVVRVLDMIISVTDNGTRIGGR